ncbi:MAG: tetratricopeptide repeat protein [Cyanobacteria bacterium P01_A01_bin.105]
MRDRYLDLIHYIIGLTLKGEIRSKVQVYDLLAVSIEPGSAELFDRCLDETHADLQTRLDDDDALIQAKAQRQQRALKTIQGEWDHWQQDNETSEILLEIADFIAADLEDDAPADVEDRLQPLLSALDPNQPDTLKRDDIQKLAALLEEQAEQTSDPAVLLDLAAGLQQGLKTWQQLDSDVVSWIYEQGQGSIGFGGSVEQRGPWASWAKKVTSPDLKRLLQGLAKGDLDAAVPAPLSLQSWVEIALVIQRLQLGLVNWFDKQPYDPKAGKRLTIATFITFTVIWGQLSNRFSQLQQDALSAGGFQIALQILRQFSQQSYFPLYGSLFAALSGEPLQSVLDYLDQPLKQVPNTTAKARILTLLGYSQRALGKYERALQFHTLALKISQEAADRTCEIASLNHLSRTHAAQENYPKAIETSQRALVLARESGDRLGEANALANYGYGEVFQARQQLETDRYESILSYLQRGLRLSEQTQDLPSQALCANSLGIAQVQLGQPEAAVKALQKGLYVSQNLGDMALQGMSYAYLSEAYRALENREKAIATGCLGMYTLKQIESEQWRYPASVLSIIYGAMGAEAFQAVLAQFRPQMIQQIGVDGYDYLPTLLTEYRENL